MTEPLADPALVHRLLVAAARDGRTLSYSEALMQLGYRFTRPKMRALCRTLAAVDDLAAARGEPELAVLVVRESDKLPGAGWWSGGRESLVSGGLLEARDLVRALQQAAFDHFSAA